MWVMALLVVRKQLTVRSILMLGLCLIGLGVIAFDPDAGVFVPAAQVLARGHSAVIILVSLGVIFLGGTQIAVEVYDRTAMFWLTRPLSRWQFVVGKFIGANLLGWLLLAVFGLMLAAMFAVRGLWPTADYFEWLAADMLRVMLLSGLLTCLSTGMGYMPAAMIGGFLSLIGLGTFVLPFYCQLIGSSPASWLLWLGYLVLPDWQHFDFGLEIGGSPVYWLALVIYTLALSWIYLAMGIIFFRSRDLSN
jgi:ABC-type transport system involved in multi-copper enzyme maturation permease subunit